MLALIIIERNNFFEKSYLLQQFEFTWHKDIRPGKRTVCFDVSQSIKKAPVILFNCHGMGGNQRFKYNIVSISCIGNSIAVL